MKKAAIALAVVTEVFIEEIAFFAGIESALELHDVLVRLSLRTELHISVVPRRGR